VGGWEIIKKLSLKVKTTKNEETEGSVELKTNLGHLSKTPFMLTFFTPNRLGPVFSKLHFFITDEWA
jgi:hypothetical protein